MDAEPGPRTDRALFESVSRTRRPAVWWTDCVGRRRAAGRRRERTTPPGTGAGKDKARECRLQRRSGHGWPHGPAFSESPAARGVPRRSHCGGLWKLQALPVGPDTSVAFHRGRLWAPTGQ